MERWHGVGSRPPDWDGCVVTIGVFDGVHRGHQAIIGRAVERARVLGVPAVVVSFDPHPVEVLRPGTHPALLTSLDHKAELIEACGVDVLCVQPFTREFSQLAPEQFVREFLLQGLAARAVVIGTNFRFGARAAGDLTLLARLGDVWGFEVDGVQMASDGEMRFSSTTVRELIETGDVAAAHRMLGRPHRVTGVVVRGDARGRELGFPTANVETVRYTAVPADGVYAGYLIRVGPQRLPAAVSVGTNPTFAGTERRVEAHVLDWNGDLYGEHVGVEFACHLRAQVRFEQVDDLRAQIAADVEATRRALLP
ncbi:MAG TPA: bifunctional riboflavin kinase/FAD synthetase [Mycobacteriales bacterium]|nr:bifunctional riboflavin kinase/FAD synthetase [Mycobacteriales bacterium]